jgi:hypothetical protein
VRRVRGGARPSCGGEPAAAGAPAGGSTRNAKSASRARGKGLPCGAAATAAALASTHLRPRRPSAGSAVLQVSLQDAGAHCRGHAGGGP